ncbi:hypothetical protein [Krasilnikovia sp. MM14-A1259]|uniref:hypothetical protein n=1 Tax=Krasilnikovia sp. MM14-A1259 TaxID=3373539 RepID=UPI00380B7DA9
MSEHSPQPNRTPDRPVGPDSSGADPTLIDAVPGDTPVPITVWRTARTQQDMLRPVSARLAYRLVSAYSRAGEAVVDLTDGHALTAACQAGRRRHHPGWFTDASSLIIGPSTLRGDISTQTGNAGDPPVHEDGRVEPPELPAWFGDDLTDPLASADDPTAGPIEPLADGASVQARTSLVVAMWPLHDGDAANRVRLAWLLTACTRLLRPGGCLVLVVAAPEQTATAPQDFSRISTAAASVGLGYLQHIVAVDADAGAEAFVYYVTDEELLGLAAEVGGAQWTVAHLRVHADLLVFSHQLTGSRRKGGEHRG